MTPHRWWGPIVLRELRLSVDSLGVGLEVGHASPLQDVNGILALVEEETLGTVLDGDAEEVMEGPRSFIVNSHWRATIVRCRRSTVDDISTMSST
jgi:hypothetical protein